MHFYYFNVFNGGQRNGNLLILNRCLIFSLFIFYIYKSKGKLFPLPCFTLLSIIHIACGFKYFQQLAITSQKHIKMTLGEET